MANIFDFIGQFSKYVEYGEIKWFCGFTKYTSYKFTTNTTIQVNELVLTPFSPFDFKCKKLNVKNLWKCICIFRASRRVSFSYFSNTALDHTQSPINYDETRSSKKKKKKIMYKGVFAFYF